MALEFVLWNLGDTVATVLYLHFVGVWRGELDLHLLHTTPNS